MGSDGGKLALIERNIGASSNDTFVGMSLETFGLNVYSGNESAMVWAENNKTFELTYFVGDKPKTVKAKLAAILTGGQGLSNQLNGLISTPGCPGVDLIFTKADPETQKAYDETILNRAGIRIRFNSPLVIFHNEGGALVWGLKYIDANGSTVGPIVIASLIGINPFWDAKYAYVQNDDANEAPRAYATGYLR